jgi:DNA repair exonuclease SbcCD ATPase subunit
LTDIDIVELVKALIGLVTVLAPLIVGLYGIWKIVIAYQDKRATAKERDHQMALELKAVEAKRAADDDERQDNQLQKAIDGITMLAQEVGKMSTNQAQLIAVMQEAQKQEAQRIELRQKELERSHSDFVAISTEMKNYVRGVSELSGNLTDQLGTVAAENRRAYQEALDKKVNEEHEKSAALIAELKAKLEKLEGYVEKDMLPILRELHNSLDTLATKEDIAPVKEMAVKIGALEVQITALMSQDTPADGVAGAVVDTKTIEVVKPPDTPDVPAKDN